MITIKWRYENMEYISLKKAVELVGVDRSTLYRWGKSGRITLYKKGRNTLVDKDELERVKAENEVIRPLYPKEDE
jgi:excisionase family DNA binding protein